MSNLTNIKVHGILAEQLGRKEWKLSVNSVSDAIRGVEANCKKFYKTLWENDRKNIKYRVLINKKDFAIEEGKDPNTLEGLYSSELTLNNPNIKTIDIVPVVEGAGGNAMAIVTIIVGVAMIAIGAGVLLPMMMSKAMSTALILGGVGLVAAGVTNLLTPMPKFGDFREIEQGGSKSYLFNGPENTIREGGPVYVAYGRLLVGSHVIQSAVDTLDIDAEVQPKDEWGNPTDGLKYSFNPSIPINTTNWNRGE
jgi:predicted phage tail protein